jgi:putative two-component system protein, hydrogenase maturation factor HypX/HoxX
MTIPTEDLKGTKGMLLIRPTTWAKDSTSQGDDHSTPRKDGDRFARRDRGRTGLMILFLTSAHNSMSQRAYVELTRLGHEVSIGLATSERAMFEAVERHSPELIVAPMLKRAIPEDIWREHVCIIIHPGPKGDRGPSSLDWAILEGHETWGVTLLQANAEMDAGDIWASPTFPMRADASKSSIYKEEVIEAAMRGLRKVVERFQDGAFTPEPLDYARPDVMGRLRPPVKQEDRGIDWSGPTAGVLRKLRSADTYPGVLDEIGGLGVFLYGGYEEERLRGEPGALIATRDGAICRATGDGAVWIPSLKHTGEGHFKLPATMVLGPELLAGVPDLLLAPQDASPGRTYRQIRYQEIGEVGYLQFAFPGGAMSTGQCRRLHDALLYARSRPTRVLVFMGGPDYFSNGIHLNVIEAAESPADESWRNINAMDDLVHDIITMEDKLTVSALAANAGAGGVALAAAADRVWARPNVVLNPHYKGMGGLYGSEYWTYLLPRRVGEDEALDLTVGMLPLGAFSARKMGLVDNIFQGSPATFHDSVVLEAEALAHGQSYWMMLAMKEALRRHDERRKPLAQYRDEELARMRENFYGRDPSYHEARQRFVHKLVAPTAALPQSRQAGVMSPRALRVS